MCNPIVAHVGKLENGLLMLRTVIPLLAVYLMLASIGCRGRAETNDEVHTEPATIEGGSMAPGLLGEHFDCLCQGCGISFQFDVEFAPTDYAVCPNCGSDDNPPAQWNRVAADRMNVLTSTKDAKFDRFAIVALQHPKRAGEYAVKRIVGLPGESIEIRNGDIFCNGSIIRKDLREQQEVMIPIFDSHFRDTDESTERIVNDQSNKCWTMIDQSMVFDGSKLNDVRSESIRYQHIRGYRNRGKSAVSDAVEDFYAYNQTKVRSLNRVCDLAVEVRASVRSNTRFEIGFTHLEAPVVVEFDSDSQHPNHLKASVMVGGESVASEHVQVKLTEDVKIYFSVFDQQLTVAVNGLTVIHQNQHLRLADELTHQPMMIAGRSGNLKVNRIRLFRDIYYLGKRNENQPHEFVGEGYVLLGDNVPISIDSREWNPCRIKAKQIVGLATRKQANKK